MKRLNETDHECNRISMAGLNLIEREELIRWAKHFFEPSKTFDRDGTYYWKHRATDFTGHYSTNGQFAAVLIAAGFEIQSHGGPQTTYRFKIKPTRYLRDWLKYELYKQPRPMSHFKQKYRWQYGGAL